MGTHTVDAVVDIGADRKLVVQLPADAPLGLYRVVAHLDALENQAESPKSPAGWTFSILADAQWPDHMPLSRTEMYTDDGR